jgi:D-threo-aldose 1-dehydrogenase
MGGYGFADPLPFEQEYDYSYDGIMRSFEASLHRLGLDQIDVLYMHDIGRDTHGNTNEQHQPIAFDGGLKAMAELREQGLVKAIGLGVNEVQVCLDALDLRISTASSWRDAIRCWITTALRRCRTPARTGARAS